MWTTVTGFNGQESVQVVAASTILLAFDNNTLREVSGQVSLQRFGDESSSFRILFEGEERGGCAVTDSVLLPTVVGWTITTKLLRTEHGGGRRNFMIQLNFPASPERGRLYQVQLLMPVVSGNARRSKMFHEALVFADQCVRSAL
jgi:hypothetical protein